MTVTGVLDALKSRWKLAAAAALVVVLASSVWWGPPVLAQLSFFRVRKVEVRNARYISPGELLARMAVDTTASVWDDHSELERRVATHPQVRAVRIERKLPGTLVLRVTENLPIAFVASPQGMRAVDASGQTLPIDPSRVSVDLPVVARPDTVLLRLLDDVRGRHPALYGRISDARRSGDELLLRLPSFVVRGGTDLTADRLSDIIPVEDDLERRQVQVAELDLRFRDQVIARLP
jgi:cell division protein FtsQ